MAVAGDDWGLWLKGEVEMLGTAGVSYPIAERFQDDKAGAYVPRQDAMLAFLFPLNLNLQYVQFNMFDSSCSESKIVRH